MIFTYILFLTVFTFEASAKDTRKWIELDARIEKILEAFVVLEKRLNTLEVMFKNIPFFSLETCFTCFWFQKDEQNADLNLDTRIEKLESKIAGHNSTIVELETKIGELGNEFEEHNSTMAGLETKIGELGNAIEGYDTKIGYFDTEITNLQVCIKRITYISSGTCFHYVVL